MNRRLVIGAAAILLIALFASFGTVRAHQAWSESNAHSAMLAAHAQAKHSFARARKAGLLNSELSPFRATMRRLHNNRAPSSSGLWDSSKAAFYDRQAASYRLLAGNLARAVTKLTASTRADAATAIGSEKREVAASASLDLDVKAATTALSTQSHALTSSSTVAQYRSISANAKSSLASLRNAEAARGKLVAAALTAGGNTPSGIAAVADNVASAARDKLSLLGVFTSRVNDYQSALQRLDQAVHAQTTAQTAAVKETDLQAEVDAISADYSKTVPAKVILVSTEDQWAHIYQDGKQIYDTPVTTGGPELPTDHGIFHIYFKASPFVFHSPWPPGSPYYYNPTPITFWMPFDGAEGLHDASWRSNFGPGSNLAPTDLGTGNTILGTHGCVNLPYDAAQFVWDWAPIGTTVVVI